MKKRVNTNSVLPLLTVEEKMVLCNCIRIVRPEVHLGVLPFVSLTTAREAITAAVARCPNSRIFMRILYKLLPKGHNSATFTMHLNDGKVAKRFGSHPERGKLLPNKTKVTVGQRWSLPRRQYEPDDDVMVNHTIALKPLKKGLWQVSVHKKLRAQAEAWLLDYCT